MRPEDGTIRVLRDIVASVTLHRTKWAHSALVPYRLLDEARIVLAIWDRDNAKQQELCTGLQAGSQDKQGAG